MVYTTLTVFVVYLLEVFLGSFFPIHLFTNELELVVGMVMIFLGTVLIVWAEFQRTVVSGDASIGAPVITGPYRVMRHPVYVSIGVMFLGVALILDSLVGLIVTLVLLVAFWIWIIPREERLLADVYSKKK